MEVTHEYEYDSETQKLINGLQWQITFIIKRYESKINPKTAIELSRLSRPGYKKAMIKECKELIEPFQKRLEEIYLTSVPKVIIKMDKD